MSVFDRVVFLSDDRAFMVNVWEKYRTLWNDVDGRFPNSPEKTLAQRKLQESLMWLEAAKTQEVRGRV